MKVTLSQYGQILGEILELKNEVIQNRALSALAKLIIRNKDQKKFSKIVAACEKGIDQKKGIIKGEVFSVKKMKEEEELFLQKLVLQKEQVSGKKVQLDFKIDLTLLGGIKLKIGDEVWDASWKKKVLQLSSNLRNYSISHRY